MCIYITTTKSFPSTRASTLRGCRVRNAHTYLFDRGSEPTRAPEQTPAHRSRPIRVFTSLFHVYSSLSYTYILYVILLYSPPKCIARGNNSQLIIAS